MSNTDMLGNAGPAPGTPTHATTKRLYRTAGL